MKISILIIQKGGDSMEFNEIVTAISTVGFPIVACGCLFYLYDRTIKDLTTILNKIDNTNQMILDLIKESRKEN